MTVYRTVCIDRGSWFQKYSGKRVFLRKICLIYPLYVLLGIQGFFLYGQTSLSQAKTFAQEAKYVQALTILRTIQGKGVALDLQTRLEVYNEMAGVFLKTAAFDSAQKYLNLPDNWEQLNGDDFGPFLARRYFFLINLSRRGMTENIPAYYFQKAESFARQYFPQILPDLELKKIRLLLGSDRRKAKESLEALETGMTHFTEKQKADFYFEKGLYHVVLRENGKAIEALRTAEQVYEESLPENHPDLALVFTYLSFAYRDIGDIEKASQCVKKALEIQEKVLGDEHPNLAISYYTYANLLNLLKDHAGAANYARRAIYIFKQVYGENQDYGNQVNTLGSYYESLANAERGLRNYQAGLLAYQKASEYFLEAPVYAFMDRHYFNRSIAFVSAKRFEESLPYLEKAYEIRKAKAGEFSPEMINIYRAFGDCYRRMKDYKKARAYFLKGLKILEMPEVEFPVKQADFLIGLGAVERELGHLDQGLNLHRQALSFMGLSLSSDLLDELDIMSTRNPVIVLDLFKEIGIDFMRLAEAETNSREQKEQALLIYLQCEHFIDQQRASLNLLEGKLFLAQTAREIFENGCRLAFDLYRETGENRFLETAFYLSGKSKSLLLLMGLQEGLALGLSNIPQTLLEEERNINRELARLKAEYQKFRLNPQLQKEQDSLQQLVFLATESQQDLVDSLEHMYPSYFALKYKLSLPSIGEVQDSLEENEALVDYFWGKDELYVFLINRKGFLGFQIPDLPTLSKQLEEFRDLLLRPASSNFQQDFVQDRIEFARLGNILFQKLLGQVFLEEKKNLKRLKIIPDMALGFLNFELLQNTASQELSYKTLPYLMREYEISYAYSVGQWWYIKQQARISLKGKDDLLTIRPEYDGARNLSQDGLVSFELSPLTYAAKEINEIARYFPPKKLDADMATETNFLKFAPQYPLIHISAHAIMPENAHNAAFIAFTESDTSHVDNLLMLDELYAQNLASEMVVLSACKTAVGELYTGEGIMSLGRAFTYAGARSIIMSLWEVNDFSTAWLMGKFYQHLAEGKSKDRALQQAKLAYLSDATRDELSAHPYFWAAFVANGEMEALEKPATYSHQLWALMLLVLGIGLILFWKIKNKSI